MSETKLVRGVDWHGWGFYYDNDPDEGTGFEAELYEARAKFWIPRRGRFVRVKLVAVEPIAPRRKVTP